MHVMDFVHVCPPSPFSIHHFPLYWSTSPDVCRFQERFVWLMFEFMIAGLHDRNGLMRDLEAEKLPTGWRSGSREKGEGSGREVKLQATHQARLQLDATS